MKETATKPGYVLVSGAHPVTVDSEVNNSPETAAVVEGSPFPNPVIPDEPVLMKVNQDGAGIGPAIFHFEGNGELSGYIADDFPVDETGLLDLQWWDPQGDNYIEPGEYTVTEKEAPPGCEPSTEAQHIKLWLDDANQPHSSGTLTFINNQEPFRKIEKRDMDNQPLAGAKFEICKDGEVVGYGVTDETGSFTFEGTDGNGLERGFYVIEEIEPPAGYLLPADPIKAIYIDPGKMTETIVIPFTNYDYPDIVIQKLDKNSRIPLAGATFEIMFDAEHTMEVGPTGPDGKVIITYEEYGKFLPDTGKESWTIQVRETGAPEGYFLTDTSWHTLELHQGQTLKPFIFEDYKCPEIVIRKSDRETEERLEGTTFEISIDAGASFSLTKQTDANGEIWITYDDYEKYLGEISWDRRWTVTVTETITTDKYNKDKQEESGDWTITKQLLPGQSLLEFDFTDTHYRDLLIRKYDSTNSW